MHDIQNLYRGKHQRIWKRKRN